jgi:hypothetical protein
MVLAIEFRGLDCTMDLIFTGRGVDSRIMVEQTKLSTYKKMTIHLLAHMLALDTVNNDQSRFKGGKSVFLEDTSGGTCIELCLGEVPTTDRVKYRY